MPEPMRVLTVRQPWAGAILWRGKDVENRSRNVAGGYRGPVAIHVALRHDYAAVPEHNTVAGHLDQHSTYGYGAIIGVVDLVDVHQAAHHYEPVDGAPWIRECTEDLCCRPWGQRLMYHLVLANPHPLAEPIPYRGGLGLRRIDAETQARIEESVYA